MELPQDAAEGLRVLQDRLPINIDEFIPTVTKFIDFFRNGSPSDQQMIRNELEPRYFGRLVGYAKQIASKAVRESSVEDLERGLAALALEGARDEYRDTVIALCLLHHSAIKLGANPEVLFRKAALLGTDSAAEFMLNYLAHGEKRIEAMGCKEGTDKEGGFKYVSVGWA